MDVGAKTMNSHFLSHFKASQVVRTEKATYSITHSQVDVREKA